MMTNRARRLRDALNSMGWETGDRYERRVCKCGHYASDEDKFCSQCGKRLPKAKVSSSGLDDLEHGISYALAETSKLRRNYQ